MGLTERAQIVLKQRKKRRKKRAKLIAKGENPNDYYSGKIWIGVKKDD